MKMKSLILLYFLLISFLGVSQKGKNLTLVGTTSITLPYKYLSKSIVSTDDNDITDPPGFVSPNTHGPDYFFFYQPTSSGSVFVNFRYKIVTGKKLFPSVSIWNGKPGVAGSTLVQSAISDGDENVDNLLKVSFKCIPNTKYYIMLDCGVPEGLNYDLFIYFSPIQPACSNVGFENSNFSSWTSTEGEISEGSATALHPIYFPNTSLSNSVLSKTNQMKVTSGGKDKIGGFPQVCPKLGPTSLILGDSTKSKGRTYINGIIPTTSSASIEQQVSVTKANSLFTYYYAVVFEASGHSPNQQPTFRIDAFDENGSRIQCGEYLVVANNTISGFKDTTKYIDSDEDPTTILDTDHPPLKFKTWTPVFIDLTQYIGSSITIRFTIMDCSESAHFGYAYIDAVCQPLEITGNSSVCNGGETILHAPEGGATYKWTVKGDVTNTVLSTVDSLKVNPNIPTTYVCEIYSVANCQTILEKLITPESNPIISTISGDLFICVGEIDTLKGTGTPDLITPWKSSDITVASVTSKGVITGLKAGSTTITYTTSTGCTRDTLLTVSESAIVTGTTSFCKGLTSQFNNTTQTPDLTTPWSSADPTIASIDNAGLVTGNASGTTTITFLSSNGCKTNKNVTVSLTPNTNNPGVIKACDSYTLPAITGTNINKAKYYDDSQVNNGKVISGSITSDKTIWIFDSTGVCTDEKSFTITIATTPTVASINDENTCSGYKLPVLNNGNYYTGPTKTGVKLNAGDSVKTTQKIYVYDEATTNASCFAEKSFQVNVNSSISTTPKDSTVCDYYVLPSITNVSYYKGTNQSGGALNAGDSIKSTQKIFAYISIPGPTGCTTERNFTITVNTSPTLTSPLDLEACDSIALPALVKGSYYTGTKKSGTLKVTGEFITSSQDIFIYDETGTSPNCFAEKTQKITINNTPKLNTFSDTSVCDSIQLPLLTAGNYFSATNQGGTNYGKTAKIKISTPIYVYAENGTTLKCKTEKTYQITVKNAPTLMTPLAASGCDSVQLPILLQGNYFTQTLKGGVNLAAGSYVKANETIFVYDETGGIPNCFSEKTKTITVNKTSVFNKINDTTACDNYTLPSIKGLNLTGNENYYLTPKNTISAIINTPISTTSKIYVYDASYVCSDEKSFTVTINPSPKINNPGPQSICNVFTLSTLTGTNLSGNQNYYFATQKNQGKIVNIPISKDTMLYIYDINKGCAFEDSFKIFIGQKPNIKFDVDKIIGCVPFTVTMLNASTNIGDTSVWYFGTDSLVIYGDKPFVNYTLTEAKCYDVSFKTSNHGCANQLTKKQMICGNSTPIADFDFQPDFASQGNPKITFINKSSNDATLFSWDFGDDSTSKAKNPIHNFNGKPQTYVITLIASNKSKCSSQKIKSIELLDQFIYYVPNTFTPDGDDLNNNFLPIIFSGFDPQSYTFTIFNRWGEILFVSHDTSVGWDGTYGSKPCLDGAYTWTIQVTDIIEKKVKNIHGHVNLIR